MEMSVLLIIIDDDVDDSLVEDLGEKCTCLIVQARLGGLQDILARLNLSWNDKTRMWLTGKSNSVEDDSLMN